MRLGAAHTSRTPARSPAPFAHRVDECGLRALRAVYAADVLDLIFDVLSGWMPATRRGWGCLLAFVVLSLVAAAGIWLTFVILTAVYHAANS